MKTHPLLFVFATLLVAAGPAALAKETDEEAVHRHLDGLRAMQVPKEKAKIDELNTRMDAAWQFIQTHKKIALPIVEDELRKAVAAPVPDQFFLLDMSFLLVTERGDKAADLAVSALERLDPEAEIIKANWEEVFHFTMKLGATGRATDRYLGQMDRLFLSNKREVDFFRAPHVVKLNQLDLGCMVYGVVGEAGAQHLTGLLSKADPGRPHVLQILRGIGSEADVPAVKAVMDSARDYETMAVCLGFMMEVGGPSGRAAVLALDPAPMDPKAKAYYQKIRPEVVKVNFAALTAALESLDKAGASDSKLQRLLDTMEENDGADNETPPAAIAKSGLPTDRVLAQLKRIRTRSFRRETNHVFEDLPITNMLINVLQFKGAKS